MNFLRSNVIAATMIAALVVFGIFANQSIATERPGKIEMVLLTTTATIVSIDRESNVVNLKNKQGEIITLDLRDKADRVADVNVGDLVTIDYIESVSMQVYAPGIIEPSIAAEAAMAKTEPGQKPAKLIADQVTVVVTIVAIDIENELATIQAVDGSLQTVRPQDPENLKKVQVGDQIEIIHTRAIAVTVQKNPEVK